MVAHKGLRTWTDAALSRVEVVGLMAATVTRSQRWMVGAFRPGFRLLDQPSWVRLVVVLPNAARCTSSAACSLGGWPSEWQPFGTAGSTSRSRWLGSRGGGVPPGTRGRDEAHPTLPPAPAIDG